MIVKILDNELTYTVRVAENDGSHLAYIGEYLKECEAIRAAREFVRDFSNEPVEFLYDEVCNNG